MLAVDVHAVEVNDLGMSCVRLPRFEDVAKVVWSESDPRGWSWLGAAVPMKQI